MATAVVQQVTGTSLSNGSSLAFGSNVTAGNLIVVHILHSYAGCPPSVAATGFTFTNRVNGVRPTGGRDYYVWTALVPSTGSLSIDLNMACGTVPIAAAYEISGQDGTTPYGGSNTSTNAANPVGCGSITPTVNGAFIGAFLWDSSGTASYTPSGSFTERVDTGGAQAMDWVQTTAAAITPEATASGSASTITGYTFYINAASATASVAFRPGINAGMIR